MPYEKIGSLMVVMKKKPAVIRYLGLFAQLLEVFISSFKKDRPLYIFLTPISFSISYLLHLQMNELLCRGVCNFSLPLHSLPATEGAHLDSHIRNTGCSTLGYILYILFRSEFDVKPFLYLIKEWNLKGQDLKWLHIFFNN